MSHYNASYFGSNDNFDNFRIEALEASMSEQKFELTLAARQHNEEKPVEERFCCWNLPCCFPRK
jgi:hypothetical protein